MKHVIYLAGGCFWGTAHLFSLVNGVTATEAGYANSLVANPTYQEVCSGTTDAVEAVRVDYDDERVSLTDLLKLYFRSIDPTSIDRQGETWAVSIVRVSTTLTPLMPKLLTPRWLSLLAD